MVSQVILQVLYRSKASMKHRIFFALFAACCLQPLGGCSPSSPMSDASVVRDVADATLVEDVPSTISQDDGPQTDMPTIPAVDVLDASATDVMARVDAPNLDGSSRNEDILGTLLGRCPALMAQLQSPLPSLVRNDLQFVMPERYERAALSPGGQRLFDTPNAGGSSLESEVMSFEVLHFCDGALLQATETEIRYAPPDDSGANSITDILVTIGGARVGVSVTRAYRPMPMVLTEADVRALLVTKLTGVNRSSMRVLPADRWIKQILHVFVANSNVGDLVERAWATIDAPTRANTIVLLTVTRGGGFIYCNPDPALGAECPSL